MPRFYFDFSDGVPIRDDAGTELPDAHSARDEAIRTLSAVARDEIGADRSGEVMVLMRNEAGRDLFTASLALSAKWLVDTV